MNHHGVESRSDRRLLILGCSQRKRSDGGLLPAIDRYDGPRFRVLRKYLRECPHDPLVVLILSAKYGIIRSDRMIPDYDKRMSAERARQLQPSVAAEIGVSIATLAEGQLEPERALVCMGKVYVTALDGVGEPASTLLKTRVARGGQGPQLARLKQWLYGDTC